MRRHTQSLDVDYLSSGPDPHSQQYSGRDRTKLLMIKTHVSNSRKAAKVYIVYTKESMLKIEIVSFQQAYLIRILVIIRLKPPIDLDVENSQGTGIAEMAHSTAAKGGSSEGEEAPEKRIAAPRCPLNQAR